MSGMNLWTSEEDLVLRELCEQSYAKKWKIIAQKISAIKGMSSRTGNQCRERYHKALNIKLNKEWTREEESNLFRLHKEVGNKWALVAKHLQGRTDNCVKNHFYSQLRKGLRKINKLIVENLNKEFREFSVGVIYKILQAVEDKFKENSSVNEQVSDIASELKDQFLHYSYFEEEEQVQDSEIIYELANLIKRFTRLYKRKPKKSRRRQNKFSLSSKNSKSKNIFWENSKPIEESQSEEQFCMEKEQSESVKVREQYREEQVFSKQSSSDVISTFQFLDAPQIYCMNVEDILEDAGVLQERSVISATEFLKKYDEDIFEEENRREPIFNLGDSQQLYMIDPLQVSLKDQKYQSQ